MAKSGLVKRAHHLQLVLVLVAVALATSWKAGWLPVGKVSHQEPPRVNMGSRSNQPESNDGLTVQLPVGDYALHPSDDGLEVAGSLDPEGHGGVHLDLKFRELGDFPLLQVGLAAKSPGSRLDPLKGTSPKPPLERELARIDAQGELWFGPRSLGKVAQAGHSVRLSFEPGQFTYVAPDGTARAISQASLLPPDRVLVVTVRGDASRLHRKKGDDILRGVSKLRASFFDEKNP